MTLSLEARLLDLSTETSALDIIGDVHGCLDELIDLLGRLGYRVHLEGRGDARQADTEAPPGRRAVFVGDLVDRGPATPDVVRLVMSMVGRQQAWCVPGNHDNKFMRWLQGRPVKLTHGLEASAAQMRSESEAFHNEARAFVEGLPHYLILDRGGLVVAHAGIKDEMIGRTEDRVRRFCLFGDTDNETDAQGLPIRYHWAAEHTGSRRIVYGHTPVPDANWFNNTLCLDTGAVFGGKLTALRWPEGEIVSVPARREYVPTRRPFGHPPARRR